MQDMGIISKVFADPMISKEFGKFPGHPLNFSVLFALAHHYRAGLAWRS